MKFSNFRGPKGILRVTIVALGKVEVKVLQTLEKNLQQVFPNTVCQLASKGITIPLEAYNSTRKQYNSTDILNELLKQTRLLDTDRVIGVTDVDIFAPQLNFVFGEARFPGRVALISIHRLRPEFYGGTSDSKLFETRVLKEAVHELGHTLTLGHCGNSKCVMFFSNSIVDTDAKQTLPCNKCSPKLREAIESWH